MNLVAARYRPGEKSRPHTPDIATRQGDRGVWTWPLSVTLLSGFQCRNRVNLSTGLVNLFTMMSPVSSGDRFESWTSRSRRRSTLG